MKLFGYLTFTICFPLIVLAQSDLLLEGSQGQKLKASDLSHKVDSLREALGVPALSIALINQKKLVYHQQFGYTNQATKEPVQSQSIYEAASLSKPLFAFWVLQQAEKGLIDLERPLHQYLPHPNLVPEDYKTYQNLNARMVLSHRSGFPNHAYGQPIKLSFKPDSAFAYSGEAYQYLAMVMSHLLKLDSLYVLNQKLKHDIFEPLAMHTSSYLWESAYEELKVYGHDSTPVWRGPSNSYWGKRYFSAYSSLHSNAEEYAKFIIYILEGRGLKKESYNHMFHEHTQFSEDNPLKQQIGQTGWGLGFAQKKQASYTTHFHTGNNHQFQSYAMFIPEKEYGLVLFTNCGKMIALIQGLTAILGPQI